MFSSSNNFNLFFILCNLDLKLFGTETRLEKYLYQVSPSMLDTDLSVCSLRSWLTRDQYSLGLFDCNSSRRFRIFCLNSLLFFFFVFAYFLLSLKNEPRTNGSFGNFDIKKAFSSTNFFKLERSLSYHFLPLALTLFFLFKEALHTF